MDKDFKLTEKFVMNVDAGSLNSTTMVGVSSVI